MNIYLIRHGETIWNETGKYQGKIDIELSTKGIFQAKKIGEKIKNYSIDKIYSSNLKRAIKTTKYINNFFNIEVDIDKDLEEIGLGEWQGKTWLQIKKEYKEFLNEWFKDIVGIAPPKGESYIDLQQHSVKVIKKIIKNDYENVVVVTHGAVIQVLVCYMLGLGLENRANFKIDNGSITKVTYDRKKDRFKVVTLNDKCHLENV